MAYAESIFPRLETTGFKKNKDILDWLSKDKEGNRVRTESKKLREISEDLAKKFVDKDLEEAKNLKELQDIRKNVEEQDFEFVKEEVFDELEKKELVQMLQEGKELAKSIKVSERRSTFFNKIDAGFIERRNVRSISVLADQFDVTNEEAEIRLSELGIQTENGKIVKGE